MSRFIAGDGDIVPPDADLPLLTAKRLLRHLGIEAAPRALQVLAVREWLDENEPHPILRRDLATVGLVEAVEHAPVSAAAEELAMSTARPGRPTQGTDQSQPAPRWAERLSHALQSAVDRLFPAEPQVVLRATPSLVGVRAGDAPPGTEGVLTLLDPTGTDAEVQSKWALDEGRFRVWLSRLPTSAETVILVAVTGDGDGEAIVAPPGSVADGRVALSVGWASDVPPMVIALVLI